MPILNPLKYEGYNHATVTEATNGTDRDTVISPYVLDQVLSGGSQDATFTNLTVTGTLTLDNPLGVASGGTGAATLTDHGVLVGSGTSAVTALAAGTNGQLLVGSTGADPVMATPGATDGLTWTGGAGTASIGITGPIAVDKGGTGVATIGTGELIVGNGTSPITSVTNGTDGQLLLGVTGAPPVFATPTFSNGLTATPGAGSLAVQITNFANTTWTPAISTDGVAPDTLTYSAQAGIYLRIADWVFFSFAVSVSAFTLGSGTGNISISGLPVAVGSQASCFYAVQGTTVAGTPIGLAGTLTAAGTSIVLNVVQNNAAYAQIALSGVTSSTVIRGQGMYKV